uniref:Uncharacterized protein n=1 Tax=Anguilla anguilla TaxID=7936 RepID=A0A0E9Q4V1_ANGAN
MMEIPHCQCNGLPLALRWPENRATLGLICPPLVYLELCRLLLGTFMLLMTGLFL